VASNKNQHFVPRCYLRPFTLEENGAAINLYNVDRMRLVQMAPVKSQCSGDYFYGDDEVLEAAIQSLESEYAAVLRRVRSIGYELPDHDKEVLLRFWWFQYLRTEAASRRAVEMNEGVTALAGADAAGFSMGIREAVQNAMRNFADTMDAVSDLKACLLRNKTDVPFVTSDDPAILTNRWHLESRKGRGHSFGINSAGAVLILPMTPEIACLAYDGDVYSVSKKGKTGWSDVRRRRDVEAINQHQLLTCRSNIFLKDPAHAELVDEWFKKVVHLRPMTTHVIHYAVRDYSDGEQVRYVTVDSSEGREEEEALIHAQAIHATPEIWPTLLTWRRKGAVYTNGTGAGFVRRVWAIRRGGPEYWKERPR